MDTKMREWLWDRIWKAHMAGELSDQEAFSAYIEARMSTEVANVAATLVAKQRANK